jgi:hypothetical protein
MRVRLRVELATDAVGRQDAAAAAGRCRLQTNFGGLEGGERDEHRTVVRARERLHFDRRLPPLVGDLEYLIHGTSSAELLLPR